MKIKNFKLKGFLKRIILTVMILQLVFALLLYTPLFLINNLQSTEGSDRVANNFAEQRELIDSRYGWALFGLWNIAILKSIEWYEDHNQWRMEHYSDGYVHPFEDPGPFGE